MEVGTVQVIRGADHVAYLEYVPYAYDPVRPPLVDLAAAGRWLAAHAAERVRLLLDELEPDPFVTWRR